MNISREYVEHEAMRIALQYGHRRIFYFEFDGQYFYRFSRDGFVRDCLIEPFHIEIVNHNIDLNDPRM